jgi:hypothetical protein
VTSVIVRIVCRFQWEDLILHLILWCPCFFLIGFEVHMFCSLSRSACLLRGSSCRFPPGPADAGLVFSSAGLSPVSASPDSSFSPARELSTRVVAGFHFALRSGCDVFVGFDLDFSDSCFSVSAQLQ